MPWSSPKDRDRLLGTLDAAERGILGFYRGLLWSLLLFVLAVVTYILVRYARPGTGPQGEWFYFGILVLLVVGWLVGHLSAANKRARRLGRGGAAPRPADAPRLSIESRRGEGVRSWELRFGDPPSEAGRVGEGADFVFSRSFAGPLRSLPPEVIADDTTLDRIEAELARGADLEEACRTVQPAYAGWNRLARSAYRQYVKALLDEPRRGGSA